MDAFSSFAIMLGRERLTAVVAQRYLLLQWLVFGIACVATATCLVHLVQRAFFHPLSRYPGPFLAKFTDLYAAYHGWKGDIHIDMWRCHVKYGNYVRYKPNVLLFNSAEALQHIHSTSNSSKFIKGSEYEPLVHRSPNTLTIRDNKAHARRRRLLAQGLSEKAQRGYESRIKHHVDSFCRLLSPIASTDKPRERQWGPPMDMSRWCYYLSFDIMADVVFGARYNLLGSGEFRHITNDIDQSNRRMSALIQIPWFASWKLDKYFFPQAIKARNSFVKFVVRVIKDRSKIDVDDSRSAARDIFAHLATAKDPDTGRGFSPNEVHAESTTLIVAGSDTSSTALSGLLFYLADNTLIYNRVAAEVRTAFDKHENVTMGPTLSSCVFLKACIDESLRMSPPVGAALMREVLTDNTCVDQQLLPAGCEVAVPIYALHHNPDYYPQPFRYEPDRWIRSGEEGKEVGQARLAFNPFSLGTRGCIGKGLAYNELLLTVATILFLGDFRFAEGDIGNTGRGHPASEFGRHRNDEFQLWDFITGQKKGPVLQFSLSHGPYVL